MPVGTAGALVFPLLKIEEVTTAVSVFVNSTNISTNIGTAVLSRQMRKKDKAKEGSPTSNAILLIVTGSGYLKLISTKGNINIKNYININISLKININ